MIMIIMIIVPLRCQMSQSAALWRGNKKRLQQRWYRERSEKVKILRRRRNLWPRFQSPPPWVMLRSEVATYRHERGSLFNCSSCLWSDLQLIQNVNNPKICWNWALVLRCSSEVMWLNGVWLINLYMVNKQLGIIQNVTNSFQTSRVKISYNPHQSTFSSLHIKSIHIYPQNIQTLDI